MSICGTLGSSCAECRGHRVTEVCVCLYPFRSTSHVEMHLSRSHTTSVIHPCMHELSVCVCVSCVRWKRKKKRADCTSDWLTGELQSLDSVIFNFRFNQANEHNEQRGLCSVRMIRKNEQNWDSGRYKHNISVTMVVVWEILCWVSSCRLQHQNRTKTLCRHYVPPSRLCIRYR